MLKGLKELNADARGILGEAVGLIIAGIIVVYVLLIFMGAMLQPVYTVIDSAVGLSLGATIKFLLGALVFFVVLALLFKVWGILTGGGVSAPQQY